MIVTAIKLEFKLNEISSLKDKRNVINSIKNKIQSRFKISVIEAQYQDSFTKSILGISFVSISNRDAERKVQTIHNFVEEQEPGSFEDMEYFIETF